MLARVLFEAIDDWEERRVDCEDEYIEGDGAGREGVREVGV